MGDCGMEALRKLRWYLMLGIASQVRSDSFRQFASPQPCHMATCSLYSPGCATHKLKETRNDPDVPLLKMLNHLNLCGIYLHLFISVLLLHLFSGSVAPSQVSSFNLRRLSLSQVNSSDSMQPGGHNENVLTSGPEISTDVTSTHGGRNGAKLKPSGKDTHIVVPQL